MNAISKILFITLSNLGDVILTLPVLDFLRVNFPKSKITVMVGPRPKEIFENNPHIERLIIYDKYARLSQKIKLFNQLKKEKFDLVIDLRNTLYGALLPSRYRISPLLIVPKQIRHMQERNLYRLARALKLKYPLPKINKKSFYFTNEDKDYVDELLKRNGITAFDKIILVSPGTGGNTRRWEEGKFVKLCQQLSEDYKVVLVGTKAYQAITQHIHKNCLNKIYDFTGLTNLRQLAYLLERSDLLITGDTGTLQIGSYLDIPIVALFGPSDEARYGPCSSQSKVIKKQIFCRPCIKAECRFGTVECMKLINVEDVLRQVKNILGTKAVRSEAKPPPRGPRQCEAKQSLPEGDQDAKQQDDFKRILIVRTDRIGDVVLSTPVIKALRDNFAFAYIAMMVSAYTKDIVEGNPYLDEVIIYDKEIRHKSWVSSIGFALSLKKKRFDLAIILHPTNRVHLVVFFTGIPKRIGYDRNFGFLLTDRIKHTKQMGEKHELEYSLDLVRYLGIEPQDKNLFMPIRPESERWAEELFRQEGIYKGDKLLAIHPGASCISRIWPAERYSAVADRLVENQGFKIFILAGPQALDLKQQKT